MLAQINPTVGDIDNNLKKILSIIETHQGPHDLIIFPELALSGYPPLDLLFRESFHEAIALALKAIAANVKDCHVIIGHPVGWALVQQHMLGQGPTYNALTVFYQGKSIATYAKQKLPNYGIFDENRYFTPGTNEALILTIKQQKFACLICEDLWQPGPVEQALTHNIDAILCINASPFDKQKYDNRIKLLKSHAKCSITIYYVNQVGGQDELLFDGRSLVINPDGEIQAEAKAFEEDLLSIKHHKGTIAPKLSPIALIYKGLVLAIKDYVEKNHFKAVRLGLSGGIDSALTLALAVDALGASRVTAVMMPSRFTEDISVEDAIKELEALEVKHELLSIEPAFAALLETLSPIFKDKPWDATEENLQARIRGLLLMALSNKSGDMVLTTSNKSETAVGYATLYGDMAGGFAPLKDVLKTEVYALSRYRNSLSPVIPERVITRAPSAELKPNQTDQDSLPDYDTLDKIIALHLEQNLDEKALVLEGFDATIVKKILMLIKRNEYKRQQSAPGPKISQRAFGLDWRMPITSGASS